MDDMWHVFEIGVGQVWMIIMDSLRSSVFCVCWNTSTTASGATKNANNWRVLSTVCFSAKNCYRHAESEYLNQNFAWRDSVFTLPRKCPSIFWILLNYKSLGTSFRIATINWNRTQGTLKFKVHLNRHSEVILSAHIAWRYQGNIPLIQALKGCIWCILTNS